MPTDEGDTVGELGRRLESMHTDVRDLRDVVVKRDDLTAAASSWQMLLNSHEQFSAQRYAEVKARVDSLEAWQTWAMRLVIGIVLAGVLALVIARPGGAA